MFLIQRSLLSAVFIPHEVFRPQKYVHSSMRGSAEGGYPLCRVQGGYPLGWCYPRYLGITRRSCLEAHMVLDMEYREQE
jgi:hypothetical protein